MAQDSWTFDESESSACPPSSSSSASAPAEALALCLNNCGLFASPATMNLCSACYRDLALNKAKLPSPSSSVTEPEPCTSHGVLSSSASLEGLTKEASVALPSSSLTSGAVRGSPALAAARSDDVRSPKPVNRCLACRKRLGLTGFKCRCGDMFCALHRYSDKHECSFDYKAAARAAIAKANPVVVADKVGRI